MPGKRYTMTKLTVKPENIAHLVQLMRGEKVMLDSDLATLYGVETGALNRAVKRNITRFPADFMFQITANEWKGLRYQSGISNPGNVAASRDAKSPLLVSSPTRGGARYRPYVFTEHGVAMLSSVPRSARAIEVNIAIMRTFVQLHRLIWTALMAYMKSALAKSSLTSQRIRNYLFERFNRLTASHRENSPCTKA